MTNANTAKDLAAMKYLTDFVIAGFEKAGREALGVSANGGKNCAALTLEIVKDPSNQQNFQVIATENSITMAYGSA